jgi:hypothetical protein
MNNMLRQDPLDGLACQDKLQHLGSLALDVVESLLTDTEAPIDIRLSTAFRIVEMCAMDSSKEIGQTIINGIEQNARQIGKNANELATLETLLKKGMTLDHKTITGENDMRKNSEPFG